MSGRLELRTGGVRPPWHSVLGMRLDHIDWPDGVQLIIDRAASGESGYCCVPDARECVMCYDDPAHLTIVNNSVLVLSDSTILQRCRALLYRVRMAETIKGADLMLELCRTAEAKGLSIGLVGGKDDDVLEALRRELCRRFPRLHIVIAISPPFGPTSEEEDHAQLDAIRASGAQLIFVGLGCPKQERWMAKHHAHVSATMVGLGAAFDFISGAVKPSAPWVHRYGFEWLYRLASEPRRLWRRYLLTAPRFLALVLVSHLKSSVSRARQA
ncbi:WecB/TagA/CpsF family glycosyltransferase [Rhizobium sp. LjRoot254]|uniref:WecB/TagA/CpsF family glycosyltransferase n=1 Tax=Rhizobium sp. LjRoot254 TaxID=3342297 RepID=UPI003ECC6A9D